MSNVGGGERGEGEGERAEGVGLAREEMLKIGTDYYVTW